MLCCKDKEINAKENLNSYYIYNINYIIFK